MLKKLAIVAALTLGSLVFADVNIRTNISDVFVGGSCEQAGAVTFVVEDDDFANASTTNPVYIRMTLDHGATLCKTLVDYHDGVDHFNDPIYLPLKLKGAGDLDGINAAEETVSIVRWVEGEDEVWIAVKSPSSGWIEIDGLGAVAPTPEVSVTFSLGISALTSDDSNNSGIGDTGAGTSNLPYSVRESNLDAGGEDPDVDDAVSTLLCVDLTNSNLEATPAPAELSLLTFDPISFQFSEGVTTASSSGQIAEGNQQSINFSNDTNIARGNPLDGCTMEFVKADGSGNLITNILDATVALCPGSGGTDQIPTVEGLKCATQVAVVNISCPLGFNTNSWIRLSVPDETNYGFQYAYDADGDLIETTGGFLLSGAIHVNSDNSTVTSFDSAVGTHDDDSIDVGGVELSRIAEIKYTGVTEDTSVDVSMTATVCMWYEEDPTAIVLGIDAAVADRDSAYLPIESNPNHRGPEQEDFCDQGFTDVPPLVWEFGEFVACGADAEDVRIFFPYVPRLEGTDFLAGVSFVNQGDVDLDNVAAHIYEADGAGWMADFGALAQRNQQTWLLVELDGVVGFYDFDVDPPDFRAVSPMADNTKTIFGSLRSSLYLVGTASVTGTSTAPTTDLDGYMIIANGTDLSGAYTPRNVEDHGGVQTGDLPVLPNKSKLMPRFYQTDKNHPITGFSSSRRR